ncbi:hypothetical protein PSHT_12634 [Puccinia striiformis]|uniref:Uncharacterized protein n=1 Tax=Puccinia striiformis TaxID=27350 RepID=A0A2S4UVD2_9BASI|nr:hypothetical protein PSHT_12634 [Puccinia striiformis]
MSLPILQESTTPPPDDIEDHNGPLPSPKLGLKLGLKIRSDQAKDASGDEPRKKRSIPPNLQMLTTTTTTTTTTTMRRITQKCRTRVARSYDQRCPGNQVELSHHELSLRRAGLIDYAHQLIAQTSHKFFEDEHRLEEWKKKIGLKANASKKIKLRLKRRDRTYSDHRIELAKSTQELDNRSTNDPSYSQLQILRNLIKKRELELARVPCIQRIDWLLRTDLELTIEKLTTKLKLLQAEPSSTSSLF